MRFLIASAVLALLCPMALAGQRGSRRATPNAGVSAPPLKDVVISVRGKLKELTKKTIVIQSDDNQMMTIRRSSKTKFVRNDKEIKPFEIDLESTVTIDVSEDNDLKLMAVVVRADPAQKKRPLGSR